MMRTAHDDVKDDLAALVAGDADAIARHASHLADCDECRDMKHDVRAKGTQSMLDAADVRDIASREGVVPAYLREFSVMPR